MSIRKILAIFVISAGFAGVVNAVEIETTPGSLALQLANVGSNESKLVIKGKIGAEDFRALANLPANITVLDLAEMELLGGSLAQPGKDGKLSYSAGELPGYVFFNSGLTEVNLPSGLTKLGKSAFAGSSLTTVRFTGKTTVIDEYAFYDCKNLSNVSLPQEEVTLKTGAFAGCGSLSSITIGGKANLAGEYIFKDSGIKWMDASNVNNYADYSLAGMPTLTGVTLNSNAKAGEGMLMDNKSLISASSVPSEIPDLFAAANPMLETKFMLEGNVVSVGDYAFAAGDNEVVILGEKVSYIGDYAFANHFNLKGIEANSLGNNIPDAEETAFDGIDESKVALYITNASYDSWASHPYWSRFDLHPGESSVESILADEASDIRISYVNDKVKIQSATGVGNYTIVGADGVTVAAGRTPENQIDIDVSPYNGKIVIVKAWNNNGNRTVTIVK